MDSVLRMRDVFRRAGWPERFVATVPDVTVGEFTRQLEQGRGCPPASPPQWPVCPPVLPLGRIDRTPHAFATVSPAGMFDPVRNAEAAIRRYQARQRETRALRYSRYGWETYASSRYREFLRWPLSLAPGSPHGDPMASLISRR